MKNNYLNFISRVMPAAMTDALKWVRSSRLQEANAPVMEGNAVVHDQAGRFISKTYSHAQGTLEYQLYIPAGAEGQALPLVVMLHGCTQSPDDFALGTRMNTLAEQQKCLVAYPAQTTKANPNRCWNWYRPADQQHGQGEPALLAGMTQAIIHEYGVDPARVYVTGLSAGGAMAVVMAVTYPELYAAAGVHSGLAYRSASDVSSALSAMKKGAEGGAPDTTSRRFVPLIVFHGDQDRVVAVRNADQVVEQAKQTLGQHAVKVSADSQHHQSATGKAYTLTCLRDGNGKVALEYWLVHGVGHAWCGGSSEGTYTDSQAPDASAEMLRFFLERLK